MTKLTKWFGQPHDHPGCQLNSGMDQVVVNSVTKLTKWFG